MSDYPGVTEIHHTPMTVIDDDFFIFGGSLGGSVATENVVRLKDNQWDIVGKLNQFRSGLVFFNQV